MKKQTNRQRNVGYMSMDDDEGVVHSLIASRHSCTIGDNTLAIMKRLDNNTAMVHSKS